VCWSDAIYAAAPEKPARCGDDDAGGAEHLGFEMEHEVKLIAAYQRAQQAGVEVDRAKGPDGVRFKLTRPESRGGSRCMCYPASVCVQGTGKVAYNLP